MPERRGRDQRAYRRATARLRRATSVCWICGHAIDTTLDYRHPLSWTADHVDPLSRGGQLLGELRPAHRRCNSSRGAGRPATVPTVPTSRDW